MASVATTTRRRGMRLKGIPEHEPTLPPDDSSDASIAPSASFRTLTSQTSRAQSKKKALLDRLSGTYMVDEHDRVLLHGYLKVTIIRAHGLRNLDCLRGWACKGCRSAIAGDLSDPYVTVSAGNHRLCKTRPQWNQLSPEWNETFTIPVAHYVHGLEFRVKDLDLNMTVDKLGRTTLGVEDLMELDATGNPLRTGVHRVMALDDKPRHGLLEYAVEFVPEHLIQDSMIVPGTYFDAHVDQNEVKLYIDADGAADSKLPKVEYGNGQTWQPTRLWRDIYDSLCAAKHLIYIAGWSVDHTQSLLRGEEQEKARQSEYSPYLGELLAKKAAEGVTVNVMVWDDRSSSPWHKTGVMATSDEALRAFCKDTAINLCVAPIVGEHYNPLIAARNAMTCTHHQKMVVCDDGQELVGYVGGIDLTGGRYDTRDYPLFRSLASEHAEDFYNGCSTVAHDGKTGPRQPWHDIHALIRRGPAVVDLVRNFEERWRKQAADLLDKLVDLEEIGIQPRAADSDDAWSCQLFRSIDNRAAEFDLQRAKLETSKFEETKGVTFSAVYTSEGESPRKRDKILHKDRRPKYERRFVSDTAKGFDFGRHLTQKRGSQIDASAHEALVYHIRRAEHCVYMESQYFLSSSHFWPTKTSTKCGNLVAAELTLKICKKIAAGERFAAYILVPMWSEGLPESSSVQEILYWQSLTMSGMYKRIAKAIRSRQDADPTFEAKPTDYLNFYCLGNRETAKGDESSGSPRSGSPEGVLAETRRHLIYVHSKMTIVDDAVALIGSTNINQRSLDGSRDSELLMGCWQSKHLASRKSLGDGEVHGFRLQCWAHVTGVMEECFRKPSSLECVYRLNNIAEHNWERYTADKVVEMDSYLMPYPIKVDRDGHVEPRTENGCFPDTSASILGSVSFLPEYLTT